jgi:hypothetical protein
MLCSLFYIIISIHNKCHVWTNRYTYMTYTYIIPRYQYQYCTERKNSDRVTQVWVLYYWVTSPDLGAGTQSFDWIFQNPIT